MPLLTNPRHEAFAQTRAKGVLLDDVYEDARFAPGWGHASRLAKQAEVAGRIAELRTALVELADANPQAVIGDLPRIAKASEDLATRAGGKEARLTLPCRPDAEMASERARERRASGLFRDGN